MFFIFIIYFLNIYFIKLNYIKLIYIFDHFDLITKLILDINLNIHKILAILKQVYIYVAFFRIRLLQFIARLIHRS